MMKLKKSGEVSSYFHKLFNENHIRKHRVEPNDSNQVMNYRNCRKIRLSETKAAIKKIILERVVEPDDIHIGIRSVWEIQA